MRVFIAGIDGYLGWTLAQYLVVRGHDVGGCDNGYRRLWVDAVGSQSVTPIAEMITRLRAFKHHYGKDLYYRHTDLMDYDAVAYALREFKPDTIVHLGEMPSAPYSMICAEKACETHFNNLAGTLNILFIMRDYFPNAHLLKLGTMGEYGTPNVDIPEGMFELEFRGRKEWMPFPRQPGSFYHLTKVHDTNNIMFACRTWGLRSTDIMQGVVYGVSVAHSSVHTDLALSKKDERLLTRFDCDGIFGTAINRFCAQALSNNPITPYGAGHQKRGFLPLCDSMQCFTLAIEKPPEIGEYRVFNQFEQVYDLTELAFKVQKACADIGFNAHIVNMENPRDEAEQHYYNPDHQKLLDLGYVPALSMDLEIRQLILDLLPYRDRIIEDALIPSVFWNGKEQKARYL